MRNLATVTLLALPYAVPGAALAGPLVVVALGDSLTQGYGLPAEEGFAPQLESWLRAGGADVRVVNAGVSGDTTAGGAARIGWALAEGADGLIVTLGGNDLLRGIDPGESRANIGAILTEAGARDVPVLLVGMEAPGNFGPDYKAAFDAIYPELAEAHGAALAGNFFAALEAEAGDPAALGRYMQPDGLHPSAEGVEKIVAALGPQVLELLGLEAETQ